MTQNSVLQEIQPIIEFHAQRAYQYNNWAVDVVDFEHVDANESFLAWKATMNDF